MTVLLPALVVVPILAGSGLVVAHGLGRPAVSRVVVPATLVVVVGLAVAVLAATAGGTPAATAIGGWPAGVAIPLVVDTFAALLLVTTAVLTTACTAFALASGEAARPWFGPLVLLLTAGVNGALLTGDLFNLFVFVEIMLLPSYGLLLLARRARGGRARVTGTRLFVVVNLLTSTLLLAGIGLTYGSAGTVVLAELAGAAGRSDAVAAAVAVVLLALGVKASVVPFHGWLPRTYPRASPAVTALFSGLHTKVAVYAIYRVYSVVFGPDPRWLWVGLVVFTATMVVGVAVAVGETTTRAILTSHMTSQIGYVLLGLALFTPLGLAAGIFYLIHNMVAKTALFLATGAIDARYGSWPLGRVSGLMRREPWVAVAFFLAALALAGLPPFSGFVAKLMLVLAAVDAGQGLVAGLAVAVSLLTLLSMLKIWGSMFAGEEKVPEGTVPHPGEPGSGAALGSSAGTVAVRERTDRRVGPALLAPGLALALVTVVLGVGAEPVVELCRTAAAGLADPSGYVAAVLGGRP